MPGIFLSNLSEIFSLHLGYGKLLVILINIWSTNAYKSWITVAWHAVVYHCSD